MWELERQTPRVEECLHFCILVYLYTHSCSISSKIYNKNVILMTDNIIIDNVSMHSWPSSLILTTLADNSFITCAKRSYKLAENLGRRHWTIEKQFSKLYIHWIAKWPSLSFFEVAFFQVFSVFTYPRVIVNSQRYLLNHFFTL